MPKIQAGATRHVTYTAELCKHQGGISPTGDKQTLFYRMKKKNASSQKRRVKGEAKGNRRVSFLQDSSKISRGCSPFPVFSPVGPSLRTLELTHQVPSEQSLPWVGPPRVSTHCSCQSLSWETSLSWSSPADFFPSSFS